MRVLLENSKLHQRISKVLKTGVLNKEESSQAFELLDQGKYINN